MVNCQVLVFFVILQLGVPVITQVLQNVTLQDCYLDGCDKNGTLQCKEDNTTGKHQCSCYQGFLPPLCKDLDECTVGHRVCKENGMCINTEGSFRCVCLPGWAGSHCRQNDTSNPCPLGYQDVAGNCTDIDECMLSSVNPCGHGTCQNTGGSYRCTCPSGWTGNRCFVDIDECGSNPCHNGNCTDLQDGFSCSCAAYWTGPVCDVPITTLGTVTTPLSTSMSSTSRTRTITSLLPTAMVSPTRTSTVTSPMTTMSLTTSTNTIRRASSPKAGKDSVNVSLLAECVAGGILAMGGGILATILLRHFIMKRRRKVSPGSPDQDTVIEVHQQACTNNTGGLEPCSKTSRSIVGIPVSDAGPNNEFSMKTRFSIQRLFRQ